MKPVTGPKYTSPGAGLRDGEQALVVTAVGEVATGLALLIAPSLVGHLLQGERLAGVANTRKGRGNCGGRYRTTVRSCG